MGKVNIMGTAYEMKYHPKLLGEDNKELYGHIDHQYNRIDISKDACLYKQHQAIIHEVTHAIDDELQIGLTEEQVRRLDVGFTSFLKGNKKLIMEIINAS